MKHKVSFFFLILFFNLSFLFIISCEEAEELTREEQVSRMVQQYQFESKVHRLLQQKEYQKALSIVQNNDNELIDTKSIEIQIRLSFGNYLAFEKEKEMKEKDKQFRKFDHMPLALKQYRHVLELDRNNEQANQFIQIIEKIYNDYGYDLPDERAI